MRGKTSLLRGWLSGAVYIQRKRSERSPPQRPQALRVVTVPTTLCRWTASLVRLLAPQMA